MVVDLAVERDDISAARGGHWLVTLRGQIQNGQATMPKAYPRGLVHPHALIIRTAVDQRPGHILDDVAGRSSRGPKSSESAHLSITE